MLGRARTSLGEHNFFGLRWIIEKFNDRDLTRLREVGPDRACAEWILRCNGAVRMDDETPAFSDYNHFEEQMEERSAAVLARKMFLTHVHADNACVTARGFRHFEGVSKLHDVVFSGCKNLEDEGLDIMVNHVGQSLRSFELSDCRHITPNGLRLLGRCRKLSSLVLTDLPHLNYHEWEMLMEGLKEKLPRDCKISSDISRR